MGCQGELGSENSFTKDSEFNFVDPSKRYGKRTHVRQWGDDELNTLSKLKSRTQSVCKTDYTEKQRLNVAKNIDAAETVITEHVEIPGMPSKSLKTGNYLITKTSSQQRDYAKAQLGVLERIESHTNNTRTHCQFIFWNTLVIIFLLIAILGEW